MRMCCSAFACTSSVSPHPLDRAMTRLSSPEPINPTFQDSFWNPQLSWLETGEEGGIQARAQQQMRRRQVIEAAGSVSLTRNSFSNSRAKPYFTTDLPTVQSTNQHTKRHSTMFEGCSNWPFYRSHQFFPSRTIHSYPGFQSNKICECKKETLDSFEQETAREKRRETDCCCCSDPIMDQSPFVSCCNKRATDQQRQSNQHQEHHHQLRNPHPRRSERMDTWQRMRNRCHGVLRNPPDDRSFVEGVEWCMITRKHNKRSSNNTYHEAALYTYCARSYSSHAAAVRRRLILQIQTDASNTTSRSVSKSNYAFLHSLPQTTQLPPHPCVSVFPASNLNLTLIFSKFSEL